MNETAFIYCLVDADDVPMYIGQTQYGTRERAYGHWVCRNASGLNYSNPALTAWLRTLPSFPRHEVLDQVPASKRREAERYYIECFLWAGVSLLNRQMVPDELRVAAVPVEIRRRTPSMITWRGMTMPVSGWLSALEMLSSTFYTRLSRGWSLRKALSKGVDPLVLEALGTDDGEPVMVHG